MTAILNVETHDFFPSNHFVHMHKIFQVRGEKKPCILNNFEDSLDLGKIFVYFEILRENEGIRLNTLYEPTDSARDWYRRHKERLQTLLEGTRNTKHIHTYPKEHIIKVPPNVHPVTFFETYLQSLHYKMTLNSHINFIINKMSMRLYDEYYIHIDGYVIPPEADVDKSLLF
jgi:hypothetical protein